MTPGMGCQQDLGVILSNIAKGFLVVLHARSRYGLTVAYRVHQ
jgi:hypothetical protein